MSDQERAHRERMADLKRRQDALVRSKRREHGLLLVHTGEGKGKSTAAFGLALRAAGQGMGVGIVQFIKGNWRTGEQAAFARFAEIDHRIMGDGFTWNTQNRSQDEATARRGWQMARSMIEAGRGPDPRYRLVVLDELNVVLDHGYLPTDEVVAALQAKPRDLHVVVTGRGAPAALIEAADTVTEMRPVKHAFDAGVRAQRGIEF